ncbi:chorismate mutase [Oharaeibacter diazotrophicus]|uniref:chorismate mutase n=1 Tax=Oharaeibacter diazotrophicus TaxID=1920512 RepID=A0A4R6RDZ8_9HYPH|nr:chorismate mutase [Oharaeibacter diazotrophicus]TDP84392.1 chorismate mutase [Oharaeibacter diazotrophicus]BBE73430.1 T-protein [Pleomorphomonas sp. SM30]GLS75221.1 hypothetical protein GCM10007904_05560 [Oharaeibacter diazotrophicus]
MRDAEEPATAELSRIRAEIDAVDERLIALLADRFRLTRAIGRLKVDNDIASVDPAREKIQIARIRRLAGAAGLDEDLAETVLRTVIGQVVVDHEDMRRRSADDTQDQE